MCCSVAWADATPVARFVRRAMPQKELEGAPGRRRVPRVEAAHRRGHVHAGQPSAQRPLDPAAALARANHQNSTTQL
jgi:hypothetical protein